jgi:hypothetical protein
MADAGDDGIGETLSARSEPAARFDARGSALGSRIDFDPYANHSFPSTVASAEFERIPSGRWATGMLWLAARVSLASTRLQNPSTGRPERRKGTRRHTDNTGNPGSTPFGTDQPPSSRLLEVLRCRKCQICSSAFFLSSHPRGCQVARPGDRRSRWSGAALLEMQRRTVTMTLPLTEEARLTAE